MIHKNPNPPQAEVLPFLKRFIMLFLNEGFDYKIFLLLSSGQKVEVCDATKTQSGSRSW
jgi:hypothetical protein